LTKKKPFAKFKRRSKMNQKTTRKYELIAKIATQDTDVMPELTELCGIDFQTAFEMWEFALGRGKDVVLQGFDLFNSTSELKTRQLFCESGPLQKLVYSSPHATNPKLLNFLVQLIMISKIDTADECLQKLRTNNHIDFNDFLRVIIDSTFAA